MNEDKSHDVTVSQDELKLLEAIKSNPQLLGELTSVVDQFNQEVAVGMDAYTAETHIVDATRKIGNSMIQQWADKTQERQVGLDSQKKHITKHGKKNSTGTAPSEK